MSKKLYIIHGWTYTTKHWQTTIKSLENDGVEVVMLHVPGLTEPSDRTWTVDDYVSWLREKLADVKSPIVLGHSNGGRIALNYLVKYPGSFKQLILLNSAGINVSNNSVSTKRKVIKFAAKILKPLKYIPLVRKVVYRLLGASDYDNAPPNMKKTLQNMLSSDANLHPETIDVPTKILWGGSDHTTPVAQGEKLHKIIPGSTLEVVDAWQHAPYITYPEELAKHLKKIVGAA